MLQFKTDEDLKNILNPRLFQLDTRENYSTLPGLDDEYYFCKKGGDQEHLPQGSGVIV